MKVALPVSWTRLLFCSSTFHSATVCRFLALSVLAEEKKLNPAGQGLCCIFPTLSTMSNGSWDYHLLFFLSTKLLGVWLKIVERTDEGQMKYPLGTLEVHRFKTWGQIVGKMPTYACYVVGDIFLAWVGSTCPFRGKRPCKSIQSSSDSDNLYPTMKYFYPDRKGLCPNLQGMRAHGMG